jgi:hypothetical protein
MFLLCKFTTRRSLAAAKVVAVAGVMTDFLTYLKYRLTYLQQNPGCISHPGFACL